MLPPRLHVAIAVSALAFFRLALCPEQAAAQRVTDGAAFTEWAARTARALPDRDTGTVEPSGKEWITQLVRNARVLGIGESAHDVHEFLELRSLITRRLIQQGRVAAVVIESGFAEGLPIDAWLAGRSSTPPNFDEHLSYGFGREAELLEMLRWIRAHNAQSPPDRQVHFYGADLPSDGGGSLEPALTPLWSYLQSVDPGFARSARSRIEPTAKLLDTRSYEIVGRYNGLSAASRDSLHLALDDLGARFAKHKEDYVRRSSIAEFAWMARLVEVARQTEEAVRLGWNHPTNPRDRAMASNIGWVEARERGRGMVLVWAHNLHVARVPIGGPIFEARGPAVMSMGQYLQRALRDRYVAIGTSFRTGGPDSTQNAQPLSVDAALANVHRARFGVEIRSAPTVGAVAAWLEEPHLMRAEDGYVSLRLRSAYDALLFLDSVRTANHVIPASTTER